MKATVTITQPFLEVNGYDTPEPLQSAEVHLRSWFKGGKGADGQDGLNGRDGADGQGVPTGGAEGQVLVKKSSEDFDTEWGASVPDLSDYYTKQDVDSIVENINVGTVDYEELENKPNIPSKTSDLDNDSGFIDKDVDNLTNYTKTSDLADVAKNGSYTSLKDKPTIPTIPSIPSKVSELVNDSGFVTSSDVYSKNDVYSKWEIDEILGDIETLLEEV